MTVSATAIPLESKRAPAKPWGVALAWMALCSVLFMTVYGATTWVTVHRSQVGTLYFDWELKIPFVPLMIIPYWSIDLFFLASFFVCSTRAEVGTLGRRIVMAILVAGACFLLIPLKLGFPRPEVPGFLGTLFNLLRGFDQPHNLFPSLHIALRAILVDVYVRHTRGPLRLLVHAWFGLVGVSTILTYQHHLADIAGGFVLAVLCFYAIRESSGRLPVSLNPRVGAYYAVACIGTSLLAALAWPWGGIFLWPALALGIVSAGYFGIGPSIYRKAGHDLPLSSKLLLAPCLIGQYVSLLHYRRQSHPWDPVTPGVWIGRQLTSDEAAEARRQGVTAVLDLTAEFSEARPLRETVHHTVPILDLTAPTPEQMKEAASFIGDEATKGIVLVHCKAGYSRSAAVVGAHLLTTGGAKNVEEALSILRRSRPSIVIRPEAVEAISKFHAAAGKS